MVDYEILTNEVKCLRSLLKQRTEERDDFCQKYQTVNQRLQQLLLLHGDSTESDVELELVNRAQDVEQRLREEVFRYKEHIGDYTRVICQQNAFVDGLHTQVEEYRSRCNRLERVLSEFSSTQEREVIEVPEDQRELDLPTALAALNQERERCTELRAMNVELREQLEVTTRTNQMLSTEVNKLSEEWQSTREDLVHRASTEDIFSDYFLQERSLMKLWKETDELKHEFCSMQGAIKSSLAAFQGWVQEEFTRIAEPRVDERRSDGGQHTVQMYLEMLERVTETLCTAIDKRKAAGVASSEADARLTSTLPKLQEILSKGTALGDIEEMTTSVVSAFVDLLSSYEADSQLLRKKLEEGISKSICEATNTTELLSSLRRPISLGPSQSSAEYFRLMAESLTTKHKDITWELNNQIEKLHKENEHLHRELRKAEDAAREHSALLKEAQEREKKTQQEFSMSMQMQESIVVELTSKVGSLEELVQTFKSNIESARREKVELEAKISSLETEMSDLKENNGDLRREREALQTALKEVTSVNEELGHQNESLSKKVKEVEQSKFQLSKLKSDFELKHSASNEKNLSLERLKGELMAERDRLLTRLDNLETAKRDLENMLSLKTKESNDFQSELLLTVSQKDSLSVDVTRLEERLRKLDENGSKLTQENERLMRTRTELKAALETALEERDDLSRRLAACHDERDAWESQHLTTAGELARVTEEKKWLSSELEDAKAEKNRLNEQLKNLKLHWESKKNQFHGIQESLEKQLQDLQDEFSTKLAQERQHWETEVERLQLEKQRLEQDHCGTVQHLTKRHSELETKHSNEILAYEERLQSVRQNFDKKAIQFEEMKAQITAASEHEKFALEQALNQAREDAKNTKLAIEACQKESESKLSQLESELMTVSSEVNSLRIALEQARAERLMATTEAESTCTALRRERDRAVEEVARLREMVEESENAQQSSHKEISDIQSKNAALEKRVEELLRETEKLRQELASSGDNCQQLKQLVSSLQQQLDCAAKEKEKARDEAAKMYRTEEKARAALAEECVSLRSGLRDAERQNQQLLRQLEVVEASLKECSISLESMTALKSQCEEREHLARRDASQWKQKVSALETECDQKHQECSNLMLQVQEIEHQLRLEKESHRADSQRLERLTRTAEEERSAFEKQAFDASRELHDAKQELSAAQERVKALESRLRVTSESKRIAEDTLHGLYTALRCTLGVWSTAEGTLPALSPIPPHQTSADEAQVPRTSSFLTVDEESRDTGIQSKSPSPGRSLAHPGCSEIKTAAMLSSVDSLVQHVQKLEVERDEARATISRHRREIANLQDDISMLQSKLEQADEKLKDFDSDKKNVELKLQSHHETIASLQEKLNTAHREKGYLTDQLSDANRHLALKRQECDRLRESNALHEARSEMALSQQEKASTSSPDVRLTRVEIEKQTLEAKLKHLRGQMKEKENECQTLKLKIDEMNEDRRKLASQKTECERRLEYLETRNAELDRELNDSRAKVLSFSDQLIEETAKGISSENKMQSLERQLRDARNDIVTLTSDNRRKSSLVRELKSKVDVLESRLSNIPVRLAESEKENIGHRTHVPSETVEALNMLVEGLQRENTRLEAEVRRLQQQLSDTIDGFLTPIASRERLVDVHTPRRIPEEGASGAMGGPSEEVSALRRQNRDLENKIRDLEDQIAQHDQRRSHELSREHRILSDEVSKLRTALRQSKELSVARERTHQQKVSALEAQVNRLRYDILRQQSFAEQSASALHAGVLHSDVQGLRDLLDRSLHAVSETPERLGAEAQRLGSAVNDQLARDPGVHLLTPSKLGHKKQAPPRT